MTSIEQIIDRQVRRWELQKSFEESHSSSSGARQMPKPLITVSRQHGTGGTLIAEKIAQRFNYTLLHRDIVRYGPGTWTVGVHFDAETEAGSVTRRLDVAVEVGLALCAVAIALAVLAGRRLSRPVQLLARAAESVRAGDLDAVPTLPTSRVRELDSALRSFRQMVDGLRERQLMRDVLGRFVPESVARTLLAGGGTLPAQEAEATLLFCDIADFTRLTERIGPGGIMALLNEYFEAMVAVLERHGGIVTQFQGDAILATFNVPLPDPDHAAKALRAALAMQQVVRSRRFAGETLACRIGINTGPVVAGAVGAKGRLSYTVHGDAVNLAARLEDLNKAHGTSVLVAGETVSRVQGFRLRPVGDLTVRGQSHPVRVFELDGAQVWCSEPSARAAHQARSTARKPPTGARCKAGSGATG